MENKEMKDRFEEKFLPTYTHHFGWGIEEDKTDKLLAFIQSEKDLAVAKREEDMANEIITFINSGHRCASDTGYSIDLNDVEDFIKNLITKHK